jgi:hypothetical protein
MRWVGHITHMGDVRNAQNILVGKPQGKRQLRRPRHDGKIILERILGKKGERVWTGCSWFRIRTSDKLL